MAQCPSLVLSGQSEMNQMLEISITDIVRQCWLEYWTRDPGVTGLIPIPAQVVNTVLKQLT